MKHPSNRELFDYWNERRGERLAPERAEIEPSAIRHVLGDTFVLEVNGAGNHLFRIAGTRLCALFGRELKTESFLPLWQRSAQDCDARADRGGDGGEGRHRRKLQRRHLRRHTSPGRSSKCCCCRWHPRSAARHA